MTIHVYFDPIIRVEMPDGVHRIPKYFFGGIEGVDGIHGPRSMMAHGFIDLGVVVANISLADHEFLFDQPDVLSVDPRSGQPRDLDEFATQAEINALVNYLDNANAFVPMGWASTADTRRAILRGVCIMFQFSSSLSMVAGFLPANQLGFTLNTQWGDLTPQQQGWFHDAAGRIGLPSQEVSDQTTVRQILRFIADSWGEREILLGYLGAL